MDRSITAIRSTLALTLPLLFLPASPARAQETATIRGTVIRAGTAFPIPSVEVSLVGTSLRTYTDRQGTYVLARIPAGAYQVLFRWPGYWPRRDSIQVAPGASATVDATLEVQPINLGEIVVVAPSRTPERVVEAPAAVSLVDPTVARDLSSTGQVPLALAKLPGVDVVQSGVNDFNLNTRGFNTSLNRRILVLQDGRDVSIISLGSQEWNALSVPLEDLGRIELVRGPGSALYGANSLTGVLNIVTPTVREEVGNKVSLAGGELGTLRADLRHAAVLGAGKMGYRMNVGYTRSRSWTRSRTNLGDLAREYGEAIDTLETPVTPPEPGFELRPLNGQTRMSPLGTPGPVIGEPDDLLNVFGSGRFDAYFDNGSVFTAEGGAAHVQNETLVTGAGRVQVIDAWRPWARASWGSRRVNLMAWYTGRHSNEGYILGSNAPINDVSRMLHVEGQYNRPFLGARGRVVLGGSVRSTALDTKGTLLAPADDDRNDQTYSAYAQVEMALTPRWKLVGAGRFDDGTLFGGQFSPKLALVFSPNERHSLRALFTRAFQMPNLLEYFLSIVAAAPADFTLLEAGLRASPLGPSLAAVPDGQLFTNSSAVPVLALGNANLDVEHASTFEVGYKGQLGNRVFLTLDAYASRFSDFVTDLLPGANPAYGRWTPPASVTEPAASAVADAVTGSLVAAGQPLAAAGLTRLADGRTAIVVSVGNAGEAKVYGVEAGAGIWVSNTVRVDANYSFFSSTIDSTTFVAGSRVLANTPKHKVNLSVAYSGSNGLDLRLGARVLSRFDWAAGIFAGEVPASQTLDATASYRINDRLRINGVATNLLDHQHFEQYGGSLIGRRLLVGATLTY